MTGPVRPGDKNKISPWENWKVVIIFEATRDAIDFQPQIDFWPDAKIADSYSTSKVQNM